MFMSDTHRRTKLTAPETISRWLLLKKRKNRSLSHPLGDLGVTYALHLWLVGKPMVDFIFAIIELFFTISYGWDIISGNVSKSAFFNGGLAIFEGKWVTLSADFRGKGASPTSHCWCQKTRVIAVLCGIKISAVHHLVLSQHMHLMEGRTDGRTDRWTDDRISTAILCVALHAVAW